MKKERTASMTDQQREREAEPERDLDADEGLAAVIDRVLDRGLVINADVTVSVKDVELLGIKIRAALASFETAAKYGLQFPAGTNTQTDAWKEAMVEKETCPQCNKRVERKKLLNEGCPWCGWVSAKAKASAEKATV